MKKILVVIIIFLSTNIFTENTTELNSIIEEAKKHNPELVSLKNKYLASKHFVSATKTLEYPQFGFETIEQNQMYTISQMLPFFGKLYQKGLISEYESKIVEQELKLKEQEIIREIKKLYWEYWLINKKIEIYQENIDIMKRFLNISKAQYATGKVTQSDILKINIELAKMEEMLIMSEQEEKVSIVSELNTLLNRNLETSLGNPVQPQLVELKYTLKELENFALNNQPKIKAKEFFYKRNISMENLSNRNWYPDLMSGIKIDNKKDMPTTTGFMAQVSVPLYYKKQLAVVNSSKKEAEMSKFELENVKNQIFKKIKVLWSTIGCCKKRLNIYERDILSLSKQSLEITESGYRSGKNSILDLLDSQSKYLTYTLDYYKLLVEKEVSFIELENVVGKSLSE